VKLFRWDVSGPYEVAFSTRRGGVSAGPYESLNLGRLSGDRPENVDENRRRLCNAVGADLTKLAMNRQRHSAIVNRAQPGARGAPGDGLWAEERGLPMLKLTADCLPIAIARTNGRQPALAVLHAGWRGLLEGVAEAGTQAIGRNAAAVIGPAIGPCCYEVGIEVAKAFTDRFGRDVLRGRHLDLWRSAELALRAVGCRSVERFDLCTSCHPELFFSHRRDGLPRGGQGVIGLVT
jgi:polyphenol oxidase